MLHRITAKRIIRSLKTLLPLAVLLLAGRAAAEGPLVLDKPQTAGMSMFRAHWDKPLPLAEDGPRKFDDPVVTDRGGMALWGKEKPGPLAFDALNRALLVRFPDAAQRIAERIRQGEVVEKVELVLPFLDEELFPPGQVDAVSSEGYSSRRNWDVDKMWRAVRPEWHAVAWRLRRPWTADAAIGPTLNAAVNGSVYWTKYGAGDERADRFPQRFGPVEVSTKAPEGRLDLTASLTDPAFGGTLAERLCSLADCGLLVMKEETYDHRYYTGAYEWQTGTGPRAILIKQPRLEVRFKPGHETLGTLPPPADAAKLPPAGKPTAVIPGREQLAALAKVRSGKPAWMPDWQWQRVQELMRLANPKLADEPFWFQFVPDYIIQRIAGVAGGPKNAAQWGGLRAPPEAVYTAWVDQLIARPVRGWGGFESARAMAEWYLYGDTLPGPAQDAIRRYWTAWLMPDRETAPFQHHRDVNWNDGSLVHPMVQDDRVGKGPPPWPLEGRFDSYWAKTGDWRGNKSFFRGGFCWCMSTQNFNTTASAGALLGGALIGSQRAMADGRHGVDQWLMRQWCWANGSEQEHVDHYYFAVTLSGNKAIADFAQTPVDRLLGQSLLAKQVEELISAWHPATRTFIAGSSRTHMEYLLGTQDGLQFILHTLCAGNGSTLRDVGRSPADMPEGISPIGHEVPPLIVAQQTLAGPWAPAWVSPMVDRKPLPYEAVHTAGKDSYRKAYLGRHYGLASAEITDGRIQCMAQWVHQPRAATRMEDVATMDLRCGVNETRWANEGGGWISKPGSQSVFQHRNRLLDLTSPRCYPGGIQGGGFRDDVKSVQRSLAVFAYQEPRSWELWIDGRKIESLPATCRQGSRIAIKDGCTFVGIVPLPATDCGRDVEVLLDAGKPQQLQLNGKPYGRPCQAAIVIDSFWLKRERPISHDDKAIWEKLARASGGFAVELADADDYADFAAFQKHMADEAVAVRCDDRTSVATATWTAGGSTMEAATCTYIEQSGMKSGAPNLVRRLVDGKDPSPHAGIERDTPFCQQGFGRLEKLGAALTMEPDHKGLLLGEPEAGVTCAWNPLPDLAAWRLELPGGGSVAPDGRSSIARVTVYAKENRIRIEHGFVPGQEKDESAMRCFVIGGTAHAPAVTLNGSAVTPQPAEIDGAKAWLVSLDGKQADPAAVAAGLARAKARLAGKE